MKKNKIAQYCCAALVALGIGLNIQNALVDYGIGENSFSLVATGGTNSGSNSGSSSNPLVPNGYVLILTPYQTCYRLYKTSNESLDQTVTLPDGTIEETWSVFWDVETKTAYKASLIKMEYYLPWMKIAHDWVNQSCSSLNMSSKEMTPVWRTERRSPNS